MAIVKVTCSTCGDVEVGSAGVGLQLCTSTGAATYSFLCPLCLVIVNKPASDAVVTALARVGVRLVPWWLPAELAEVKSGPPLTHEDLLAFHLDLAQGSWHEELAALWESP